VRRKKNVFASQITFYQLQSVSGSECNDIMIVKLNLN